ncbi:hypothetical protein N9L08_01610 [Rhodobacteraceae bacterium]|nr:hypothetical protein [Paracoccaceae bacterium]
MQSSEAVQEQGFRRLKLKVGHANLSDDIVRIAAVRKAVGPDIPIAVDANGKWKMENGKWKMENGIFPQQSRFASALKIWISFGWKNRFGSTT